MNLSDALASSGPALSDLWRAASLAAGWVHPGDWYSPAVDGMAQAVVSAADEHAAAQALGVDRAANGVGLAEALNDLGALYQVADQGEPSFGVARSFAEAWSETATAGIMGRGAIDAITGLGTRDYLEARVSEVYAEERATGIPAGQTWCFISVGAARGPGWNSMIARVGRARVVASVLDRGESNAALPSGGFVSLARADSAAEHVLRLRHRLRELGGDDPEVALTDLPETRDAALALMRSL